MGFLKDWFEQVIFKKNNADTKKSCKLTQHAKC